MTAMPLLVAIALFVVLLGTITAYGYRAYARPARMYEHVGARLAQSSPELLLQSKKAAPAPWLEWVHQLGSLLPVAPGEAAATRRDLIAAGYRSERALQIFYGLRIVLCATLAITAFLMRERITANPVLRTVLPIGAALAGFALPSFLLQRRIQGRQEQLRLSLPDALDLLVISVEAGMGLDQAIQNVSKELAITHREVSEELSLVTLEMRAGKRRADALRDFAVRTDEPEIRKLVAILIQSDRFGTGVGESLRTHSDFMRVRRRQDAEERAGKVGVKLVFPIFFFILPSMLVVAAGPGLLQVFKYLFPMMRSFGQ
jgi:tight adherence protein C